MSDIPKDKMEEFPALGSQEEKKAVKKPAEPKEEKKTEGSTSTKLKITGRTFVKKAAPVQPVIQNFYVPHIEPSIKEQEWFPTLGETQPPEDKEQTENNKKHEEFLERHEMFKPYISLIPRDLWFVPQEYMDPYGYPVMGYLPELYTYLWTTYNMFFNPDGTWATNSATVMSTLSELWQHAEWRDRVIEKEQKEIEKWEREMKEWEEEYYDEFEDGISLDDGDAVKSKNKKKKKKKPGKKKPPPPPKAKESYKRFQKDKDETVIAKPKSSFKDPKDIINEESIVEVDETRDPSSLVFIGHVDVGKSTICGNLMYMTGMVDERTIDKFKKEAVEKGRDSWWLAYVMDINDDEKSKGKTVEVGRATLETKSKRYTIFDAPGHKNYVPDMIMGAAMADAAALVISARKGEYESGFEGEGQTREHAQLARSLGVEKLIVIVNKMDEESVNWDEERYNEIVNGVTPFLVNDCGYNKDELVFIPISGLSGENIEKIGTSSPWYTGPPLIEILDNTEIPKRDPEGPLRIPILDRMKDRGLVAFGKVESGTIEIGTRLSCMPNDIKCQATAIYNCKQQLVRYAKPGENIQIKLRMIDDDNLLNKGDVLCNFDNLAPLSELFEAEIQVLELLPHRQIITPGYKSMMHLHTIADEIVIKKITGIYEIDGSGDEYVKKNPKYCKSGSKILAMISTRVPVCLEKYSFIEHMGRFTLRDEGKTIALGKVLRYKPAIRKSEDDIEQKEKLIQRINEANQQKIEESKVAQSASPTKESGGGDSAMSKSNTTTE